MILQPKFTEKSLNQAQQGRYTFRVPVSLSKGAAKREIESLFKVKVAFLWALKKGAEKKQTRTRHSRLVASQKTIVATLKSGKIDFFENIEEGKSQKEDSKENVKVVKGKKV